MFPSQIRAAIDVLAERLVYLDGLLRESALSGTKLEDLRNKREAVAAEIAQHEGTLAGLDKTTAKIGMGTTEASGDWYNGFPGNGIPVWATPAEEAQQCYDTLEETLRHSDDLTKLDDMDQYRLKQLRYLIRDGKVPSTKKEEYQRLVSSFDKARIEAQGISNVASIKVPFNAWSMDRLDAGEKVSTSRTSKLGNEGDTFVVKGKTFEIESVSRKSLSEISHDYYFDEGAKSPEEFELVWESLHPSGFRPSQIVYFHQFRELTPDVVELKKLIAKPGLTQTESQKAVLLTQKMYKTEARNTLTPEENIALNKQVRKNLADSYTTLFNDGEVKAAKVAQYRKRQLEQEYNTLIEIRKKSPVQEVPEVPEVPPLDSETDKGYWKSVIVPPFATYEPIPTRFVDHTKGIHDLSKPVMDSPIPGAPYLNSWLQNDASDIRRTSAQDASKELTTEWFQSRGLIRQEAQEESKGIVSLPQFEFDTKTIGVPTEITSPLFIQRTPKELEAIKKAEKRSEELEVVKEVKEKNLFINTGKPGGKLVDEDFYEPRLGEEGTIYYKPVFFRTKEGTIQYAGENPKIMLESRLSQDTNPKTTFEDLSFTSSGRLEKIMKERGEAYHYEQYDRDIILSNKGLPVKKLDEAKRDEERFKKEFVTYYLIDHPEQLQPWLDKADPKTLKYLNEAWGGLDVVRRQYLPQIEYVARDQKGERVVKSLSVPKTNYDLPDDLVADRALREKLIQKGLIESAESRLLSIPSLKPSKEDLLTHEPDKDLWIDAGVSTRKIINAVEAETGAKKNTVVYLIEDELPTDPIQYAQLVKDVQSGKKQYLSKIGEEIKSETQEVKVPEPGLGMSVSSDILNLLKPQDVPKGIRRLDVSPIENDVQVVRFIPQLNKMAPFRSIEGIRAQALGEIATDDKALRVTDPTAVKGTVIYAVKNPEGNVRQKGTIVAENGALFDFIEYNNPDAKNPILEYNKRYTIPKPTHIPVKEGETRVTIPLNENRAVYTPYENYQITTKGKVKVVEDYRADETTNTFQWGYIEDEKGNQIKWTTFKEDNPPILESGQDYTVYNAWMQAHQKNIPKWDYDTRTYLVPPEAGKPELNINLKPQNIYAKDTLAEGEDAERIKNLRDSTYRTLVEPGKPGLFEQSPGLQPKPRAVQPPADPVIATAIEDGKPVVITRSGKHIPSAEYLKLNKPVGSSIKVGVAHDEATLDKIEAENPLDDEALYMMGLIPLGAMGLIPGLSPKGIRAEEATAKQASGDRIAAEQNITMGNQIQASPLGHPDAAKQAIGIATGTYNVASELASIWGSKLKETYQRTVDRTADYDKEAAAGTMSPYRKYLPVDLALTGLDVMGAALHPLSYPLQAVWGMQSGLSPMEGIRQEITPSKALDIKNPLIGLGADIVLDPLNLVAGVGLVNDVRKGEEVFTGLKGLVKGIPELLRNEDAILGRKMPSDMDKYITAVGRATQSANRLKTVDTTDAVALKKAADEFMAFRGEFRQALSDIPEGIKTSDSMIAKQLDYNNAISSLPNEIYNKIQEPEYAELNMVIYQDLYSTADLQRSIKSKTIETAPEQPVEAVTAPVEATLHEQKGRIDYRASAVEPSQEGNAWDQWMRLFEPQETKATTISQNIPRPDFSETKLLNREKRLANKVLRDEYDTAVAKRKEGIAKLATVSDDAEFNRVYNEVYEADRAVKSHNSVMTRTESKDEMTAMLMLRSSLPKDVVRRIDRIELKGMGWTEDEITASHARMDLLNTRAKEPVVQETLPKQTVATAPVVPVEPIQIEVSQPTSPLVKPKTLEEPVSAVRPAEPGVYEIARPVTPIEPQTATAVPEQTVPVVQPEIIAQQEAPVASAASSPPSPLVSETPVTLKDLRQKNILLNKEIEKRGIMPQFPWKTAALGIGAAGIGLGAYSLLKGSPEEPVANMEGNATSYIDPFGKVHKIETLSQEVAKTQTESINDMVNATEKGSKGFVIPGAVPPRVYPNVTSPVRMPMVGDGQPETAMGVEAGTTSAASGTKEEKSFLGKVFDVLQTASYLEGAAITGAQSLQKGNGLEYEWGITPSEALGLKSKEEGMFDSWAGFFGSAMDIVVDPTTYISLGTGTAAKVGTKAGVEIALNPKGLAALTKFAEEAAAKGISKKEAESIFADTLLNPAVAKRFEPSAGLVLRGWGPLSSNEVELVSKARLDAAKGMPKERWDAALKKMATSGNPSMLRAAEYLYDTGAYAGAKVDATKDFVGKLFTPFYNIKKTIPRPVNLPLGESEYADKFMLFKKGVRYKSDVYFQKYETMREAAKKELGDGYKEIISKYVEAPVLIDSAGLSPKTREIISTIQEDMKVFAAEETSRGLLDSSVDAYLKHILTPEAKEYLAVTKKTGTEIFLPLRDSLSSAKARGYKGTIEEINTVARQKLGFDFFDTDPFKAAEVSALESVHATGQYDFLEYVTKYYGEAAMELKPGYSFAGRTPQLMNVLPQDVAPEMTEISKGILRKLEPGKVFTSVGGKTYTAEDILKLADDAELISERTAGQAARDVVVSTAGKKIVTVNPSREEIARMTLLADRLLNKGMSEKDAVEAAAKELTNIRVPEAIAEHLEPKVANEVILDKTIFTYGANEFSTIDTYDSLLSKWKWAQTVWALPFHMQNIIGGAGWNAGVLGEVSPTSFVDSYSILGRSDKSLDRMLTSARGEEQTGAELIEIAGEHGVFGQPGWMDIEKKLDPLSGASTSSVPGVPHIPDIFSGDGWVARQSQKVSESSAGKLLDSWGPAGAARHEENWMRFAVFLDRWKKGDTAEEAAKFTTKYMIEYMPEAYTDFERAYMLRMFPFYKYARGNIPLQTESMLKQPGKYATLGKLAGEYAPDYSDGSLVLPSDDPGKVTTVGLPVGQMSIYNDPWLFGLSAMNPLAKAVGESYYKTPELGAVTGVLDQQDFAGKSKSPDDEVAKLLGTSVYTDPSGVVTPTAPDGTSFFNQKPYGPGFLNGPVGSNLVGRVLTTTNQINSSAPMNEKVLKTVTGASTFRKAVPRDKAELTALFAKSQQRINDFSYEQKLAAYGTDKMVSPLSGIGEELQVGHLLPAALGGKPEMSNALMQTREENYENMAAQVFMTNVPEKEFVQQQFWADVEDKYATEIQKDTDTTTQKLNEKGLEMNDAIAEKVAYDAKKKGNVQLYSRELSKIRMQKDWAERMLRTEERNLETKRARPGFMGDPVSDRQVLKLKHYIPQYQAKYDEIFKLREEERAKVFDLPDQIMRGEDFSFETMENKIVIKGKGPTLAEPDKITNMVKYEDLAFDRAYIYEYAPVIDLQRYLGAQKTLMDPKIYGNNALKQPDSKEWKAMQERAKKEDAEIFAPESMGSAGTEIFGGVIPVLAERQVATTALTGLGITVAKPTVPVAPESAVQDTTKAPVNWAYNNSTNVSFGNITLSQAFGMDLDGIQSQPESPAVKRVAASDLPLRGSGIPSPYTISGWNAKLQSDRAEELKRYAQIQGIVGAGGEVGTGNESVVVEPYDINKIVEDPEFVAAVETIATRLYDDQINS
nr:MAG: hypothetical protein OI719_00570 [Candidatus Methanoperedens sp.]